MRERRLEHLNQETAYSQSNTMSTRGWLGHSAYSVIDEVAFEDVCERNPREGGTSWRMLTTTALLPDELVCCRSGVSFSQLRRKKARGTEA